VLLSLLVLPVLQAFADDYADTVDLFRNALEDRTFVDEAYGYAVFPTVGKGGWFLGGAYGEGRVFARGDYIGDVVMTQLTLGLQLGGQAYSQIVVFQDERALREFIGGNFEFGAQATAVASCLPPLAPAELPVVVAASMMRPTWAPITRAWQCLRSSRAA